MRLLNRTLRLLSAPQCELRDRVAGRLTNSLLLRRAYASPNNSTGHLPHPGTQPSVSTTSSSSTTSPSRLLAIVGVAGCLFGIVTYGVGGRNIYSDGNIILKHVKSGWDAGQFDSELAEKSRIGGEVFKVAARSRSGSANQLTANAPKVRPQFTRDEVSSHNRKETGIWIIHQQGVYDITEFVDIHPGGDRILLAAGRSIDPFWAIFHIHQSPHVKEILEQYRIGDLAVPDASSDPAALEKQKKAEEEDRAAVQLLFANDPQRDPSFIYHSKFPCNAETPAEHLHSHITPNHLFFVRHHLPVPRIDSATFKLQISGPGIREDTSLSLSDLKQFPPAKVEATLQCAGNRRKEMQVEGRKVNGLMWGAGAIGNAVWEGVYLRDVLLSAGFTMEKAQAEAIKTGEALPKHVHFTSPEGYSASIPLTKVLSPDSSVLLATHMNGEPLPVDHGAPLRAIVPGHVAARSVKWVTDITLSDEEADSPWQRRDYKGMSPSLNAATEEIWDGAPSVQETPVQSVVLEPANGSTVTLNKDGQIPLKGYAFSGGGRKIVRVDVSVDGGKSWVDAKLEHPTVQPAATDSPNSTYSWTHWSAQIAPAVGTEKISVICKAVDESYNVQPDSWSGIFNFRGILANAWWRGEANVHDARKTDQAHR
ncbi:Oxidoreductase, molybdopterin-binding domain-containing protein [Gaertneriomyces semiglobifer]|nr:Oxidoreductase, molybdopterin-binding domain-containing protein [Gaertneriomyces semiglobifer]